MGAATFLEVSLGLSMWFIEAAVLGCLFLFCNDDNDVERCFGKKKI